MLPDFHGLPLRSQIAQMLLVRASGFLSDHQIQYPQWEIPMAKLTKLIAEDGIGGVILVGGSAGEIYLRTKGLQDIAPIPLLIAADVEEGVGQRFLGATHFPPPMAINALNFTDGISYAQAMGAITAKEAAAIGINWLLAPVVDVNNNRDNPVINVRSFGENSELVGILAAAFIQGASNCPVLTTAKHFPGHGDTLVDSHLQTPTLAHSRERFDQVELLPFKAAIAANVDAVMSAHVFAPHLDASTISTLSPETLTGLLRQELGFRGLVVTDALIMAGVSDRYSQEEVAVRAVLAGADILLMPVDADRTINAIEAAVNSGVISRERLQASLARIWQAKSRVINVQKDLGAIATPKHLQIAAEITTKSIRIHNPKHIYIKASEITNLIVVDDILTCHEFLAKTYHPQLIVDQNSLPIVTENIKNKSYQVIKVFLQIFSRGNPFRGNAGISNQIENLVITLMTYQKLQAIAIYGSPYNLERIKPMIGIDIPWAFSYSFEAIAQQEVQKRLGISR